MESSRDRRSRQAAFVLSAGALAGVLIWAKLRLVTDIPRSAYAVPDQAQPVGPDQNGADSEPVEPADRDDGADASENDD